MTSLPELRLLRITASLLLAIFVTAPRAQPAPSPGAVPQNSMAQRMQACVVCHGREGRATNQGYFPRIAGKPAGYLYSQLKNFQAGRRKYAAMNHLVEHMSDDYLRGIADYFAGLDLPYPPAQPTTLAPAEQRAAEALVWRGSPERGIPACVACHGQQLAGMLPATPGLLTLPADYLSAQMGAWRTGQRKARAPDCMAQVANKLSPDELSVMAKWLSSQTLSPGTKPAPASNEALPIRCGSLEP
ncbi:MULTISPECIES: c-type cytochrome [Ramlibacter]|uniref:C-type cytochrome n=1 Tax=Ramlibacter pinisoli TaxID=2682844 RepID=A0A6N8ITG0_9BURK|nr:MULTISPECIES: c-type cytochrome [Ramlibacter]MBA2965152.1 c-type cytochrome [Ramlibacter sp. CGMCC 1.13660]MVQ30117.1 c-type cytochrome [Ramlibacter pinisoli]